MNAVDRRAEDDVVEEPQVLLSLSAQRLGRPRRVVRGHQSKRVRRHRRLHRRLLPRTERLHAVHPHRLSALHWNRLRKTVRWLLMNSNLRGQLGLNVGAKKIFNKKYSTDASSSKGVIILIRLEIDFKFWERTELLKSWKTNHLLLSPGF